MKSARTPALLLFLLLACLILASCTTTRVIFRPVVQAAAATANTATNTPAVSPTPVIQTITPTLPPSATPPPTATPSPTPTLVPGNLSIVQPPLLDAQMGYISLSSAEQLERKWRIESTGGPFAFSPDSRWLAVADGAAVRLWDLASGQNTGTFFTEGGRYEQAVAFDPTARLIAAVESPNLIRIWEAATGRLQMTIPMEGLDNLLQLIYTTNGGRLIGLGERAGQPYLRFWDAESGQQVAESQGSTSAKDPILVSPNGVFLIQPGREGILRLWNPQTGERLAEQFIYACPDALTGAAFSPDGQVLAMQCSGNQTIFLDQLVWYRPGDRRMLGKLELEPLREGPLSFNRDGALLAAVSGAGDRVLLLNLYTHQPQSALGPFPSPVAQIAFSPNGKLLAIRFEDGAIEVWGTQALY